MGSLIRNRKVFLVALLAMLTSACTMSSCRLGTILLFGYDPGTWCDAYGSYVYVAEAASQTGGSIIPLLGAAYGLMYPSQAAIDIDRFYSDSNIAAGGVYFGSSNSITVLNGRDQTLKRTFGVTPGLRSFRISRTGKWLLETSSQSTALSVYSLDTGTLSRKIDFGSGAAPFGIAIQPDDSRAYITDSKLNLIYSVNFLDGTYRTISEPGQQPGKPALTPDALQLFVPNVASSNIFVLDTMTETPVLTIPNVAAASEIAFNQYGTRGYVLQSPAGAAGSMWTFDPGTYMSIGTTPLGNRPSGMSFTDGGTFLYSAMSGDGVIKMIDPNATPPKVLSNIPVGLSPVGVVTVSGKTTP